MAQARNKVTGRTLSADEATLRRLGSPWVIEADKPKPTRKAPAKKSGDDPDDDK